MGLERRGWAALRVTAEGFGLVVGVAAVVAGAGVAGVTLYAPPVSSYGPLPGAAQCRADYTPEAVADREFAFDGTVLDVGEVGGDPELPMVPVTFDVHAWYHGGAGDTVTVDLPVPLVGSGIGGARRGPSYGPGTRLLVSGEVREQERLTAAGCGFTRYHDVATAAAWAALD